MELSSTGFWATVYRFCRTQWDIFSCHGFSLPSIYKTDLCTFIRTVFLWFPLSLFATLATWAWVAYALAVFIWNVAHNFMPFVIAVSVIVIGSLLLAIGLALIFGGEAIFSKITRSESYQLGSEFMRAKKAKICPQINFTQENRNARS